MGSGVVGLLKWPESSLCSAERSGKGEVSLLGIQWTEGRRLRFRPRQLRKGSEEAERSAVMLVSRHRIGEYLPEVVHQGPDPAAVAVCREVLAESGAESVILHGSRGWGGWDDQSDLNVIVIHHAAGDEVERDRLRGEVVRVKELRYRDSSDYKADLESGPDIVTPEDYAARRRTLNHTMARAARAGTIFPKEPGVEGRYRHDGDTSDEWELVTAERLRLPASRNRDLAILQEMHRGLEEQRDGRYSGVDAEMAGRTVPTCCCGIRARRSCPYWASSTPCARRLRWPAWSKSTTGLEPPVPKRPGANRAVRRMRLRVGGDGAGHQPAGAAEENP